MSDGPNEPEFEFVPEETLTLSKEGYERLVHYLENPPEPNEKLKEAARKYDEEGFNK